MKGKTLAILGIGTYILSILASAENLEGAPTAPLILIAVSGIATLMFVVFATMRLWAGTRILAALLPISTLILFVLTSLQAMLEPSYGSPIIISTNLVKVINLAVFILVILRLFRMDNVVSEIK